MMFTIMMHGIDWLLLSNSIQDYYSIDHYICYLICSHTEKFSEPKRAPARSPGNRKDRCIQLIRTGSRVRIAQACIL